MLDYLFETSREKPMQSVQKFHRLFTDGITLNGNEITVLSSLPVNSINNNKIWWNFKTENDDGLKYMYLPFINLPYLRQTSIAFFSFIQTFYWWIKNKRKCKAIICDVLNVAVSSGSLFAARICGIKTCAIVTDIPVMMGIVKKVNKKTIFEKLAINFSSTFMQSYDCYVLLTEFMNDVVNTRHKPYIVIEGLVDIKMRINNNSLRNKAPERILIYAGAIYEKYGIKNLIEAFRKLEGDDLRLYIYGSGEMEKEMPYYMNLDKRVVYQGFVPNKVIIKKELEATLLINPRPSDQEFTKYSFPSKNMEYMVSGTPLVTTALPGMPEEYKDYVYIFSEENVYGIYLTLKDILSKPREELHAFGNSAKKFMLENKNNIIQAEKLLSLIE